MNKNQKWRRVLSLLFAMVMLVSIMVVGSVVATADEGDNYVAKIGEQGYTTLQDAIDAANNGDTVKLVADINENVTCKIGKNIVIDGCKSDSECSYNYKEHANEENDNYQFTGTINLRSAEVTIKNVDFVNGSIYKVKINNVDTAQTGIYKVLNCTFTGKDPSTGYAITVGNAKSIEIDGCKVDGLQFFYLPSSVATCTISNVDVNTGNDTANWGIHLVSIDSTNLTNVNISNAFCGVVVQNNGQRIVNFENCTLDAVRPLVVWEKATNNITFNFKGENFVRETQFDAWAIYNNSYINDRATNYKNIVVEGTIAPPVPATTPIQSTDVNVTDVLYNGSEQTADVKVVVNGVELTADTDYTVSGNKQTAPDKYTLVIEGKGDYTGTVEVEWTIKAAAASVTKNDGTVVYCQTLKEAIEKANTVATDTVTLLADVSENVTIEKALTLDGNNKQFAYTGTITVKNKEVKVQNVQFVNGEVVANGGSTVLEVTGCSFTGSTTTGYAVKVSAVNTVDISNCTVNGVQFLYIPSATANVKVDGVTVNDCNWGIHVAYSDNLNFSNVQITNAYCGIVIQNYGNKKVNLTNVTIDATKPLLIWEKDTNEVYFNLFGTNDFGTNTTVWAAVGNSYKNESGSEYSNFVFDKNATLVAPDGLVERSTNVGADYQVVYANGVYSVALKHVHTEETVTENEVAPGCETDGSYDIVVRCADCGEVFSTEHKVAPATGHSYTTTTVAPTFDAQGYDLHTCSVCGHSYKDKYTEATKVIEIYTWEDLIELDRIVESGNTLAGITVKLMNNINLYKLGENGEPVTFNPIGNYNKPFMGTFDGQNYTIENMYQNGWDLGYEWGSYGSIGLFGGLDSATVKNLTIKDAECFVEGGDVGAITGSAEGNCTFEHITVTNSVMATYNNGCGGLIGWAGAGNYTFNYVTVDNKTVIAGLWGSFDSSLGGVMGQLDNGATATFNNVTVACRLDAYNDVTASYKYYAYRMCGMLIGRIAVDSNNKPVLDSVTIGENVNVTFGDWATYTYIWDDSLSYGCKRVEAGYAYGGIDITQYPDAQVVELVFKSLFGGMQYGCYGQAEHEKVEVEHPSVATINGKGYWTLEEALDAAQTGDVIVLVSDVTVYETLAITKNVTLDLAGYTVTGYNVYPVIRVLEGATATVKNGTIKNADYVFVLGASDGSSAGYLTIESGTYVGTITVASVTKGTLTINGGNFSVYDSEYGATYLLNCVDANYTDGSAKIVVKGGTFTGFNPANNTAEGVNTNFCAEGYCANENNGVYTVASHVPGDEATCTTAQTCTVCGEELTPATGHTPGAAATCTTAQTCTVCNVVLTSATGHSYNSVVTAPTFDTNGYTTHTCVNCGYSYTDSETEATKVIEIYTWDDLKKLDAIVEGGNMLEGITVKLMNDIDLYEMGADGEPVTFNPIGANTSYFRGTFDGQGYTIKNMYQSGWALGYDWDHYGSIGLFAYLWDATIKNVVIENAECFVEGGNVAAIAGCAWGDCTFEDIKVVNSTFATYNNRAGGIVGYTGGEGTFTFKNILVDEDTVIAGLWGSFDSSIGGIMGQLQSESKAVFENVTVECRLDIYNDVTAAYKYHAYRMCGMLIGRIPVDSNNQPILDNVTIGDDVNVVFGDWATYTYIWDDSLSYGCKRVEEGYAYGGIDITLYPDATVTQRVFKSLFGGQQLGCYGQAEHEKVEVEHPSVATINGKGYWTLEDAVYAAVAGDVIVLVSDVTVYETLAITKNVTLDLAGYTVSGYNVYPVIRVQGGANVTVKNGTVKNTDYVFVLGASDGSSAGYLTIESGTYIGTTTVASVTMGTLTINGGNFSVYDSEYGATYLLNCVDANYNNGTAKIVVKGGTFTGFNPANNTAEGTNTNFCAEGYCVAEADGVWTVVDYHTYGEGVVTAPTFDAQGYTTYTCVYCDYSYVDENSYVPALVAVAQIGDKKYVSLPAAVEAAQNGDIIVLVKDVTYTEYLLISKKLTLDLNGKTVRYEGKSGLQIDGTLTLVDSSAEKTGKIYHEGGVHDTSAIALAGGNLIVNSGTVYSDHKAIQLGGTGKINTLVINGGYIDGVKVAVNVNKGTNTVTINGGKLVGNDVMHVASENIVTVSININGGEFDGVFYDIPSADVFNLADSYCLKKLANAEHNVYTVGTHNPVAGTPVAPTCTEGGYTVYTCAHCGASENKDVVPATGHSYTTTTVAPTFDAQGYDLHTCSVCGHSYKDNYVAQRILVATLYDVDGTTVLGNYETLMDALRSVTNDKQYVVVYQDVTEYIDYTRGEWLRGNILPAGDEVTITLTNTDYVYCAYTFAIYEGVTLKMNKMFYYAGDAAIYGDLIVQQYYQSYAGTHLHIVAPGSFTVTSHEGFTITNTEGDPNAGIYVWGDNDPNTVELSIPVVYAYEGMIFGEDATIEAILLYSVDNLKLHNSTLKVKGATDYNQSIITNHNTNIELYHNSHIQAIGSIMTYGSAIVDKTSSIKGVYGDYEAQNSTSENIIPATCTTPGSYVKVVYCGHCGTEIYREDMVIPVVDHTAGTPVKENETVPTYSKEGGYDLVTYCTVCGVEMSREYVTIPVLTSAAEVNGVKYGTLKDAIAQAKAGDTIYLLKDLTEDVTINKNNLIIDGNGFKFTGKMTVGAAYITVTEVNFVNGVITRVDGTITVNYTVTNCTFTGKHPEFVYAIIVGGGNTSVFIDNCTADGVSMLHVASSSTEITVKNSTVINNGNGAWSFYLVPAAKYLFENVTIDNSTHGIVVRDSGAVDNITLKNCEILATRPLEVWQKESKKVKFTLLGNNDFGTNDPLWGIVNNTYNSVSGYDLATIVLGEVGATLKAGACETVSEFSLDYYVVYNEGVYSLAKALKFASSNLLLTDTIGIYFNVDLSTLEEGKRYVVEIRPAGAAADSKPIAIIKQVNWLDGYKALYNGLAAKQMADEFTATIVCVDDDTIVCRSVTESVKGYAERGWDIFGSDTKALLTATLNYGAAAQIAFEYNVDNLANSFLTVKKDENVTDDTTVEDTTVGTTEETNKAPVNEFYYYGASLHLESNIIFNFKFFADGLTATGAQITYVDANGKTVVLDVANANDGVKIITEQNNSGTELIVVKVNKLFIQDAATVLTCTLTLKDEYGNVVVRTATDSLIYYCERAIKGLNDYQENAPEIYAGMTFKQEFYYTLMEYVETVNEYKLKSKTPEIDV